MLKHNTGAKMKSAQPPHSQPHVTARANFPSLTERDGELKHNWYIACLGSELKKGKALQVVLYDEPYVLFRDAEGKATCLPDRCLHRNAQLSKGTVQDGQIACPYHGWVYDSHGKVVDIPSENTSGCDSESRSTGASGAVSENTGSEKSRPGAKGFACGRFGLKPLPCAEQDGAVWVHVGGRLPLHLKPPYRFPYGGTTGWTTYFMVTDFDNETTHLAENFMDVPHTVFVHSGWFRDPKKSRIPITIETSNGTVLVTYDHQDDKVGYLQKIMNPRSEPTIHTDLFVMPNITRVDYEFGSRNGMVISSQMSPVSTLRTRVYTWIAYKFENLGLLGPLLRPFFNAYTRKIIQQDVEIMANQGQNFARNINPEFHHTPADDVHLAIERLRDLGAKGDERWKTWKRSSERVISV